MEAACLARFGTLRPIRPRAAKRQRADLPESAVPAGLSRLSADAGSSLRPYPGANGMIERFFRRLKESASGTRSRPLRRRGRSFEIGSHGTTRTTRIRCWAIEAQRLMPACPTRNPGGDFRESLNTRLPDDLLVGARW